jgi:hypothetical protein
MTTDLVAIFSTPNLLTGFALGGFLGMAVERLISRVRRQAWRKTNPITAIPRDFQRARSDTYGLVASDATDQLRIVLNSNFKIRPILNKGEARVFRALERIVTNVNPAWQVMAQVSLGEILSSESAEAYRCINSKRVDLLLMDDRCRPRHVIEYQGTGHHRGSTAAARDAVKKEALRRAGVGYHEVVAGHTTPAELKRLVERLIDPYARKEQDNALQNQHSAD